MAPAGRIVRLTGGSRRLGATRSTLPAHPAALVAAAIGLGCLMVSGAAVGESPTAAPDLEVTVADGRLSVRVGEAPLDAVLEAIAAQAEVAITIRGDPGMTRSQSFADLPLEIGIRRLADERRLLMVFARPDARGAPGRLLEVRVYGNLPSDDLAHPRRPLTRTLGKVAGEAPAPPSYQALIAKDKGQRLGAIRDLARRQDEAAIEALGTLLAQDLAPTVRRIAATALGNIGGETVVGALEAALADSDVEVRIQAMRGLHVIEGETAAASLGELALRDPDPALRRQAVHLLATLRNDEARSTIELAATDPDDTVRQAAEAALTRPRRWR